MRKAADVVTPLLPHQQRAIDKLRASGGLLAAWGTGSGKTLGALAAADALARERGLPLDAVVPASLVQNLEKEMDKHLDERPADYRVRSYEKAVRDGGLDPGAFAVLDEAQRVRNKGTQLSQKLVRQVQAAPARLLLSATPAYNSPVDAARLLNVAAGKQLLPDDPRLFASAFVGERLRSPPLLARLRGMKPVPEPYLKDTQKIVDAARGYVDVHPGGGAEFPARVDEEHEVPMTSKQYDIYKYHQGQMPWYLRVKIQHGLPLTKQESKDLNTFAGAIRQTSNTPRPYLRDMTDEEEEAHSPKIQKMVEELASHHGRDPNFRGVVYSNYLDAGLLPYARALAKRGVPHAVFHGGLPAHERRRMVEDYNAGRTPVLLLSSAGGEGLDLKGTKLVQVMEPSWNQAKIDQVIGRGIRHGSHAHLPPEERTVKVQRFYATPPKTVWQRLGGSKPPLGIDRYLKRTSDTKHQLGSQMMAALQRASDLGPLEVPVASPAEPPTPAQAKAAALRDLARLYGVKTASTLAGALGGGALGAGVSALNQLDRPEGVDWRKVLRDAGIGAAVGGAGGHLAARDKARAYEEGIRTGGEATRDTLLDDFRERFARVLGGR